MRQHLARPNLTLALMALVVGLALAWQLKGPRASPPVGYTPGDPRDRSVHAIEQLEAEQSALKAQIASLRADLSTYQSRAAAETDRLQRLNADLDAQMAAAGLTAVYGPGVAVTLDDSHVQNASPSSDPNALLIHEYDLRDVINVLWLAGAEAISINEERIVANTSVYCVGSTVMVNTTRLSPPYTVRAIGEPAVLADTLRNPAYLTTLRRKAEREGIIFKVMEVSKMTLPAYIGGFSVQHSNPR